MVITQTPYRISFFGGGTDYPSWYTKHPGGVICTTIDKYCYITCRYLPNFFKHKYRIVYSKIEECSDIESILHPPVKACLRDLNIQEGIELHHDGDLPAKSGVGSSSAFTVGLLKALYALKGEMISKKELANKAIYIEQNILHETVGCQDQIATSYGGLIKISFTPNDGFSTEPLSIKRERILELQQYLLLFYTGNSRISSEIAKTFAFDLEHHKVRLERIYEMVQESINILNNNSDIRDFGLLLNEYWLLKRGLSNSVSTTYIDNIYSASQSMGAIGGKITGAGGGGMMLLFVEPEKQPQIIETFRDQMLHIPFQFTNDGSKIIYYNQE
jgi:D-glycero-alpha-D-manno-heptose-7-phosphate kinase